MNSIHRSPAVTPGTYAANEMQTLYLPAGLSPNNLAGRRCLLAVHGRGGTSSQPGIFTNWLNIIRVLCDTGQYVVLGIDCGSQAGGAGTTDATRYANPWSNDAAMTAITAANTWLLTTMGANGSTKLGVLDYSLGAGQGFNWLYRNSGKVSGIISFAPAVDYNYLYNNFSTTNSGGAAEVELSYAATKTTTTGTGTLNQVGANLTITSGTGFPASGTCILYPITTIDKYVTPLKVTYTGGGGTTTLTGCTIVTGSQTWGTNTVFTGVATFGGYAANAATRDPTQIAASPVFDAIPIHLYLGADDATVGRGANLPTAMASTWIGLINADFPNHGVLHSVPGRQRPLKTTLTSSVTLTTAGQNLGVTATANFSGGGGNAVIETGAAEPTVIVYTGISGSNLTGAATLTGSQAVASPQVIYPSALDGHTALLGLDTANSPLIDPASVLAIVNGFSW